MTRWLQRAAIAAVLIGLSPTTASAQFWDFVKWFDDLSGPQMVGAGFELPLYCTYHDGQTTKTRLECSPFADPAVATSGTNRKLMLGVRTEVTFNLKDFGDAVTLSDIALVTAGPSVAWAPFRKPVFDLVGSFQIGQFAGETVDNFWVATADAGFVVKPMGFVRGDGANQRFARAVRLSWRYKKFFNTFDGAQFGAPGTFTADKEWIKVFTVGLEFGFD